MHCWNCGTLLQAHLGSKIPFREECEKCGAALHCCKNCCYYKPGCPNDCMVPGTEYVSDRSKMNFCEEFKTLGKPQAPKKSASDVSKMLFGDEEA